jgi:hypothetical protein
MNCLEECRKKNSPCKNKSCRLWVDYKEELNCCCESVKLNGQMSLREVAARLNISFVRVKQIESAAIDKLAKRCKNL